MINGRYFLLSLALISALVSSTSFAQPKVRRDGTGTYLCSLKITRNPFQIGGKGPQYGYKVLADLQDHEVLLTEVARDKSDWKAYQQVFEGVLRTLRKETFIPTFFMVRLIPDELSGNQSLKLEVSIQMYNKFAPARFSPIIETSGNANDLVEVIKSSSEVNTTTRFSCRAAQS